MNNRPTTAQVSPHYTRYGTNGYDVFCVGFANMFFETMKKANAWAKSNGITLIK